MFLLKLTQYKMLDARWQWRR